MPRQIQTHNNYFDRLLKLIPAEWVSAYIAIKGVLDSNYNVTPAVYYVVIVVQLLLLPFYLRYALRVDSKVQISVTVISFLVWVFSLGGQHLGALSWYENYYGSITIILWTSTIPMWDLSPRHDPSATARPGKPNSVAAD